MLKRSKSFSIPKQLTYRRLLEFFFQIHDPTTSNRQGNDIGTSYRSAIFYTTDEQRQVAEETIADVNAAGIWPGRVVTEVVPATSFWEAEPEHQDYLERIPNGYTCHFIRPKWVLPRRSGERIEAPFEFRIARKYFHPGKVRCPNSVIVYLPNATFVRSETATHRSPFLEHSVQAVFPAGSSISPVWLRSAWPSHASR